jgi:hypothetical protein
MKGDGINHNGSWCVIKGSLFCQEGYCPGCWVTQKWDKILDEARRIKDVKKIHKIL